MSKFTTESLRRGRRNDESLVAVVRFLLWALCASVVTSLPGCESYRIEYRQLPAFYHQASLGGLPERTVLPDGTVVVYGTHDPRAKRSGDGQRESGERKQFHIREEMEDGTIVLRGIIPEHVLANFITCLVNEEYELLYDELLSEHTKQAWAEQGNDVDDLLDYFAEHRTEMLRTLNRIEIGLPRFEAVMEHVAPTVIELRLQPSVARIYRFTAVRMIQDGVQMKLLNIR